MPLDRIRQVGDVILVDSVDSLSEGFTPERYSRVINDIDTESIRSLNKKLHSDSRVDISIVPIGDGLTLALKK